MFKIKAQIQALQTFFTEFCANSSIHGVRYFTQKKAHWSERFWWAIAFFLSVYLCAQSIQHIWTKWNDRPIVMSLSEKEVPISEIPFPVVTICPQTKTTRDKLDLVTAYHLLKQNEEMNLTDIELSRLETLSHICKFSLPKQFHPDEKYANESIYEIFKEIAPPFSATFDCGMWRYVFTTDCSELFTPIFTREGICYTFNDLNSRDIYTDLMAPEMMTVTNKPNITQWNYETGYEHNVKGDEYPMRLFNAKYFAALSVHLKLFEQDFESLCKQSIPGFKVILSVPGDSLEMSRHYVRVPILERVSIAVKAKIVTTSEELRDYKPNQRGCFYDSERKLFFFKRYAQTNCEAECLANFTAIKCGCARFSMPREAGTQICGSASIRCYQKAENSLFGEDIINGLTDMKAKSFRLNCNCLPSCSKIVYDAEIDRTPFDFEPILKAYSAVSDRQKKVLGSKMSHVVLHFKKHSVVTMKRLALYTSTDFLSICGGLLGLFLGVSALSIIEFFYYLTLRLYWKLRQMKRKRNSAKVTFKRNIGINRMTISTIDSLMDEKCN